MLSRVARLILVTVVVGNINCESCDDKKSRKLNDFDGTRRNLISTTTTSCNINFFDIDSVSELTLNSIVREAKELRMLNLSSNRISTIQNDTFNQFPALERLKLGDNFLTAVRSHYFNGLKELSVVDLSSNLIDVVDENSFASLESLLWLSLADNCIVNLALHLPLVALDSINLSLNLIANFPRFKSIKTIDSLDVSYNTKGVLNVRVDAKFSQVERDRIANTRAMESIKSLNVAYNEISNLTQLRPFVNLDELDLSGNPIDFAAGDFPHWTQLEKLNLSDTELASLDGFRIAHCKQFTWLSVVHNPLQADFDTMAKFPNLQHLHFSSNLCTVPDSSRDVRRRFPYLTHVTIHYEKPHCECEKLNQELFSLSDINFSTNWHHVCSRSQSLWVERRRNAAAYFIGLIAFHIHWLMKL